MRRDGVTKPGVGVVAMSTCTVPPKWWGSVISRVTDPDGGHVSGTVLMAKATLPCLNAAGTLSLQ